MSTGYYLEDHPNPNTPQYGWPRTWASGVVGVHTTESGVDFEGADPGAENTAAFIGRRTDYGSYHILADWDTILPLTRPTFAAWADTTNNVHALSVSGAMDAARWRDLPPERAAQIVRNMGIAAAMLVQDAIRHGVLKQAPPARRITAQQAIDGSAAGFYGHGETNPGTRYDPGQNFDWDLFLATYAATIGGGITYQGSTTTPVTGDDEEMLSPEAQKWLKENLLNKADGGQLRADLGYQNQFIENTFSKGDGAWQNNVSEARHAEIMGALGKTLNKEDGGYIVKLIEATRPDATDPEAVADALAGLIPDTIAAEVVEAFGRKLTAGQEQQA